MTSYETTQSGLSFLIKTISEYQSPGFFLFFALGLLVLGAILGGRRFRMVFLWPLLILSVTVFNPYLFPLLFERWPGLVEAYYRFLWLFPAALITGGTFSLIAFRFRMTVPKFLLVLTFAAGIALLAVPGLRDLREMPLPANALKSDPELIMLCDYITEEAETDTPVIAFEREDYAAEAAAYNPLIRISPLLFAKKGSEWKTGAQDVDFFVVSRDTEGMEKELEAIGCRAIARTPENLIYASA